MVGGGIAGAGAGAGADVGGNRYAKRDIVLTESIVGLRWNEVVEVMIADDVRVQSPVAALELIVARAPEAWTLCAESDIVLV